jgi:sterol desaturase/sphingolipid hydroxylase (fatty acid hydroxylase superfamily)
MKEYIDVFVDAFVGTAQWTWNSILFQVPWYTNYFWGLVVISLAVWGLEIAFPWRKNQKAIRKDFWLDGFYMFFNFFIFSIVISGFYSSLGLIFGEFGIKVDSLSIINLSDLNPVVQLLIFFIVLDFVQWFTHVILHRVPLFWEFHKVHHSVEQMGFAAHLRYHWMENILYKPLKTLGVMVLGGFEPEQAYIVHFVAITIGHLNHANIKLTYGPLKYIFNNPVMHLWHHSYDIPKGHTYGVNYAISLSVWDYLFRTAAIPDSENGEIKLGFPGVETFPTDFGHQSIYGFSKSKK